ncbi:hypothetical protein RRG08_062058 [Elysia crispata]|uniref:Uncharacterized protein n=1 Tax=Elysia crispata TaxID=231223 RepID=A0AAE0XWD0_9GAST|nr:hypothetical protein RRG08_062058 [Elysia crispata]
MLLEGVGLRRNKQGKRWFYGARLNQNEQCIIPHLDHPVTYDPYNIRDAWSYILSPPDPGKTLTICSRNMTSVPRQTSPSPWWMSHRRPLDILRLNTSASQGIWASIFSHYTHATYPQQCADITRTCFSSPNEPPRFVPAPRLIPRDYLTPPGNILEPRPAASLVVAGPSLELLVKLTGLVPRCPRQKPGELRPAQALLF